MSYSFSNDNCHFGIDQYDIVFPIILKIFNASGKKPAWLFRCEGLNFYGCDAMICSILPVLFSVSL